MLCAMLGIGCADKPTSLELSGLEFAWLSGNHVFPVLSLLLIDHFLN